MSWDWACFRCGQVGHLAAACPTRRTPDSPPAPPVEDRAPEITYTPPSYSAPPRKPHPPTDEYLEAKAALAMGSGSLLGRLLSVPCPWCGRGKMSPCANAATGQRKLQQHEARYAAALVPLPPGIPGADRAMEQVQEARAARGLGSAYPGNP